MGLGVFEVFMMIVASCIFVCFIIMSILKILNSFKNKHENTEDKSSANRVTNMINNVGNANFFNEKDGKFYEDVNFTIEANDNTGYLLQLFNLGGLVQLPEGNFLCRTKIILKGKNVSVSGVPGKSRIVFDSYAFINYGKGPLWECLIINEGNYGEYVPEKAQYIDIRDVVFEYKRHSYDCPKTILLFRNIQGCLIDRCTFIADLNIKVPVTNLDFYNACKNVKVQGCSFVNTTKAGAGSCIWVRNLTSSTVNKIGNTTENVVIDQCSFKKDSSDEVIAIYSSIGDVRNVRVENCDIKDESINLSTVLSAYSSKDGYYGTVDQVSISNNNIYSKSFKAFIICVGRDRFAKPASNVEIIGNTIQAETTHDLRTNIIYSSLNNGKSHVLVKNNIILAKKLFKSTAIKNVLDVTGNTITGELENGIYGGNAINNNIDGALNAIVSPVTAEGNTVLNTKNGIKVFSGTIGLVNNTVYLSTEVGFCGILVNLQCSGECIANKIYTNSTAQYGFIIKSIIVMSNNLVIGPAKNIYPQ